MTELQPGQRVRVSADAEVVRLPDGHLGVEINDEAHPLGRNLFHLSVFDVQPIPDPWKVAPDVDA